MISGAFEVELMDSDKDMRNELAKYGPGALNPGEKAPFRIRRRGRLYECIRVDSKAPNSATRVKIALHCTSAEAISCTIAKIALHCTAPVHTVGALAVRHSKFKKVEKCSHFSLYRDAFKGMALGHRFGA